MIERMTSWLDGFCDWLDRLADPGDAKKRTERMRASVAADNEPRILENLFEFQAPLPDRLRPRIDEVIVR